MISIITPSFNRAYIIDETAQSVFEQSSNDWEWIIVDDGSTDGSWEKVQTFADKDSRVRIFQRDREPKGACTCRNIGAENALGTHLIFLDTDDLLGPNAILERASSSSQCTQNTIPFYPIVTFEADRKEGFWWDDKENPVSWLTGLFTMTPPCQGTAPLWPRDEFLRIGGWREDLRVWQDVELHIRAYVEGLRFEAVPDAEPDIFLRLSPDSISHVNFHSSEKMKSRWNVVQYALKAVETTALSETEVLARQNMVLSVFQNALSLRDFTAAHSIIDYLEGNLAITRDQIRWMRNALRHQRWRLYKIPKFDKRLRNDRLLAFPFELNRKLGSIKWK